MTTSYSRRSFLKLTAGLVGAFALSRAAPVGASEPPLRPLILVHGFADRITTWQRPDNAIVSRLTSIGYRWESRQLVPFAFPPIPGLPDSEDSEGDIAAIGLALAGAIRELAGRSASGQVDLIGLSMGGLIARWAINHLRSISSGPRSLVNTAVLIGAPNDGVDLLGQLARLAQESRASIEQLAREIANLDLASLAATQMVPGSALLAELNDPQQGDPRVRYGIVAGAASVHVTLGAFGARFGVGDGIISPASASHLPGLPSRVYLLPETLLLDPGRELPWNAVRRMSVLHGRLIFNDLVGLATVSHLAPSASALHAELAGLAEKGLVQLLDRS